jgi:hypothetical protein
MSHRVIVVVALALLAGVPVPVQASRLTADQAWQIAARFCREVGAPAAGAPKIVFPAPSAYEGQQDFSWQPCWSVTFVGESELRIVDATGVVCEYFDLARFQRMAAHPPTGPRLSGMAAVKLARRALRAAGRVTDIVAVPESLFQQISPGNTAGDTWSITWQRQYPNPPVPYQRQQAMIELQAETGALVVMGIFFPSPPPASVVYRLTRTQAVATARTRLEARGIRGTTFKSIERLIVQPNTYWEPGGSVDPKPYAPGRAAWHCEFQESGAPGGDRWAKYYDVNVDGATGAVIGGEVWSMM